LRSRPHPRWRPDARRLGLSPPASPFRSAKGGTAVPPGGPWLLVIHPSPAPGPPPALGAGPARGSGGGARMGVWGRRARRGSRRARQRTEGAAMRGRRSRERMVSLCRCVCMAAARGPRRRAGGRAGALVRCARGAQKGRKQPPRLGPGPFKLQLVPDCFHWEVVGDSQVCIMMVT
jgi:hypothetical protein